MRYQKMLELYRTQIYGPLHTEIADRSDRHDHHPGDYDVRISLNRILAYLREQAEEECKPQPITLPPGDRTLLVSVIDHELARTERKINQLNCGWEAERRAAMVARLKELEGLKGRL